MHILHIFLFSPGGGAVYQVSIAQKDRKLYAFIIIILPVFFFLTILLARQYIFKKKKIKK